MMLAVLLIAFVADYKVRAMCRSQNISRNEPYYEVDPNVNNFCVTPILGFPWMFVCTDHSTVTLKIWAYNLENINSMIDFYYWIIPGNARVNSTNARVEGITVDPVTREVTVLNISKPFYGQYTLVVYLNREVTLDFGYGYNISSNVIYMKDYLNYHNHPLYTSHNSEYRMSWIVSLSTSIGFFCLVIAVYALHRYRYQEDEDGIPLVQFGNAFKTKYLQKGSPSEVEI
ncbi:hypothetical protein ACOME3_009084 [Neoechinorhynchus agilis]